jgi:hypothetical protein
MIVIAFVLVGGSARAADLTGARAAAPDRLAFAEPEMPAPKETTGPSQGLPAGPEKPAEPVGPLEEQGSVAPADLYYGGGARLRYVSVPSWLLNLFTARNVPLNSFATAGELFRRKGNFDFMLSIGYQNMSPPDGNWLGKSHDPATETDYVQFKGLSLLTFDLSFIWRTWFSQSFGMHYGAGLGVGVVFGQLLRTSSTGGCGATGDVSQCHPQNITCTNGVCNDMQLNATQLPGSCRAGADVDGPGSPHRFCDNNVPGAVPIVNVVVGVDFRLPQVPGLELKLEGGFYDAFFLGGGLVYMR